MHMYFPTRRELRKWTSLCTFYCFATTVLTHSLWPFSAMKSCHVNHLRWPWSLLKDKFCNLDRMFCRWTKISTDYSSLLWSTFLNFPIPIFIVDNHAIWVAPLPTDWGLHWWHQLWTCEQLWSLWGWQWIGVLGWANFLTLILDLFF